MKIYFAAIKKSNAQYSSLTISFRYPLCFSATLKLWSVYRSVSCSKRYFALFKPFFYLGIHPHLIIVSVRPPLAWHTNLLLIKHPLHFSMLYISKTIIIFEMLRDVWRREMLRQKVIVRGRIWMFGGLLHGVLTSCGSEYCFPILNSIWFIFCC